MNSVDLKATVGGRFDIRALIITCCLTRSFRWSDGSGGCNFWSSFHGLDHSVGRDIKFLGCKDPWRERNFFFFFFFYLTMEDEKVLLKKTFWLVIFRKVSLFWNKSSSRNKILRSFVLMIFLTHIKDFFLFINFLVIIIKIYIYIFLNFLISIVNWKNYYSNFLLIKKKFSPTQKNFYFST